MTEPRDIAAYLSLLTGGGRGDGWIELRHRSGSGMRSEFFPASPPWAALQQRILRLGPHCDVYVGCSLRRSRRGSREHVSGSWVLWAECDAANARTALADFVVPPSFLVASGSPGHVHAYWALTVPVDADTLEERNRRLSRAVGGDPVCYDAARILRPPGTLNHKRSPARPVSVVSCGIAGPYELEVITGALPPTPAQAVARRTMTPRDQHTDLLLTIEPETYVVALTGQPVGPGRKISCPFHRDCTPSLHVYRSAARGWVCFGCKRGGTIYDLAAALWRLDTRGTDFLEVKRRLEARFL